MSSKDLATQRIGENLLRGWTLLGDNCPNGCLIPLMRSRDRKQLLCVSCGVDFNEPVPCSEPASVPAPAALVAKAEKAAHSSSGTIQSVIQLKLDWLAEQMEASSSVNDLAAMVTLANQLLDLRTKLDTN